LLFPPFVWLPPVVFPLLPLGVTSHQAAYLQPSFLLPKVSLAVSHLFPTAHPPPERSPARAALFRVMHVVLFGASRFASPLVDARRLPVAALSSPFVSPTEINFRFWLEQERNAIPSTHDAFPFPLKGMINVVLCPPNRSPRAGPSSFLLFYPNLLGVIQAFRQHPYSASGARTRLSFPLRTFLRISPSVIP